MTHVPAESHPFVFQGKGKLQSSVRGMLVVCAVLLAIAFWGGKWVRSYSTRDGSREHRSSPLFKSEVSAPAGATRFDIVLDEQYEVVFHLPNPKDLPLGKTQVMLDLNPEEYLGIGADRTRIRVPPNESRDFGIQRNLRLLGSRCGQVLSVGYQ
jgi:hypothetical protein